MDTRLRDILELERLLKKSKSRKEREEIRRTIEEIKSPPDARIVPMPPRPMASELSFWKRRFAARLAEALRRSGLSLERLSFATKLPYHYLKDVAAGRKYPAHRGRSLIAKATGVPLRFLES